MTEEEMGKAGCHMSKITGKIDSSYSMGCLLPVLLVDRNPDYD